jgi:uncharacterized protein (DUF433 family)
MLVYMAQASTGYKYLERDPLSSYKQLSIKGRRIRARTLYGLYVNSEEPMSIQEIADGYGLPIEAVEEAIAYCRSDPPEIREDFLAEELYAKFSGMDRPDYDGKPKPLTAADHVAIQRALDENLHRR